MSLDKKKGKKGKNIPIEPEDDDIGKKKRGRSASPAMQNKKAKTSGMSTPTKKKWKCGYKKSKSPKNKKKARKTNRSK